ncbi:hypothetical protein HF1_08020 [Mycoplasma haemofelis str. Langford 1]|uniref:Uncharacterized protein n=1 Tax=Mycoplasma haemofelis (strain Langford 1) TaxID=941640 RepID=E8ZI39_MYCHL|nr:hypothetical protein [Mycoplasma haemofelis]CBY92810.1 hypothetical protein HF1_08020 [Mycoplasma haemofelis str. Langford 1]
MTYAKLGAATLGTAGAAGGGYLAYPHVFPERTLLDELKSQNKSVINGNESQWTLKKELYNKGTNSSKITIDNKEKASITEAELKKWCSDNLKAPYSKAKDSILGKVEKWCLKPNIKEALSKETKEIISFTGTTIDTAWDAKLTTNSSSVKGELIDKWKLPASSEGNDKVSKESLRDACQLKIEGEYISENDENYTLSKKWCLKP